MRRLAFAGVLSSVEGPLILSKPSSIILLFLVTNMCILVMKADFRPEFTFAPHSQIIGPPANS